MITKEQIDKEIAVIAKEVAVARNINENNKPESVAQLILLRATSEFSAPHCMKDHIEWITYQVFENKLPEMSSGSFITALSDGDGLAEGLGIEDEEMYDYLVKEINKI